MKATKEVNKPSCLYNRLCLQANVINKQFGVVPLSCPTAAGKTCPRLAYLLKNRIPHLEHPFHEAAINCPCCKKPRPDGLVVPHEKGIDIRCPECGNTMITIDHGVSRLLSKAPTDATN